MKLSAYSSWGNLASYPHYAIRPKSINGLSLDPACDSYIGYGNGRSYGDVCINSNNGLIDTTLLDRFIDCDEQTMEVSCQAGVRLAELLDVLQAKNLFVPVTPGTSQVTIGGMIANDVHGKNHHRAGSFGNHLKSITLLRSNGDLVRCSAQENTELFKATIGGLGLTGLILTATFSLKKVRNNCISVKTTCTKDIQQLLSLIDEADRDYEYTVAWLDMHSRPQRGILSCGNHTDGDVEIPCRQTKKQNSVPFVAPNWLLNATSNRLFNRLYFFANSRAKKNVNSYGQFFYPLDKVDHWNRLYGKRGFYQYQFVVPYDQFISVYNKMLAIIDKYNETAYLAVLKKFGDIPSSGYLSFPRAGYTLAMDFPNKGQTTLAMLAEFDHLVLQAGGAVYPAKDARMRPQVFAASFPQLETFIKYKDEKFCSDFWRRVMSDG